jgi:3-methylcrotonyl-CoA carboxylase alpha subunit
VKLQFAVAAGEKLPFGQADITQRGHAIECRVYAEDTHNGFLPAVGPLLRFVPPDGPGVRVDSGVQSGDTITIHYDPMIAKIITYDATREAAIARMQGALARTVILGTTANLPFLQALLAHPAFLAGEVDTRFIEANLDSLLPPEPPPTDAALIAAALSEMQGASNGAAGARETRAGAVQDVWSRADGFRMGSGR